MFAVLLQRFSISLPIKSSCLVEKGCGKTAIYKKGNKPAIDKLADFCNSRSLLKNGSHLQICFIWHEQDDIGAAFQRQISADLGSLTELLPTLLELYSQLVVVAINNDTDQTFQADSSNRLFASLKRHPE